MSAPSLDEIEARLKAAGFIYSSELVFAGWSAPIAALLENAPDDISYLLSLVRAQGKIVEAARRLMASGPVTEGLITHRRLEGDDLRALALSLNGLEDRERGERTR